MKLILHSKIQLSIAMVLSIFLLSSVAFAESDVEGSKDHPLFTRMPNHYISIYEDKEFDSLEFSEGEASEKSLVVEGHKYSITYRSTEGAKVPSPLEVRRNYTNAIKKIGGKILSESQYGAVMSLTRDGKEIWAKLETGDTGAYDLTIVEKAQMVQVVKASDMLAVLNKEGHIALHINFDTGQSTIKPDSQPVLDEIVALMKNNPALKISVEGHTDNVGDAKKNKTLSAQRAKGVVEALVKQGVETKRLSATGFGQDRPIADNSTEKGRVENRRVELVKKE